MLGGDSECGDSYWMVMNRNIKAERERERGYEFIETAMPGT